MFRTITDTVLASPQIEAEDVARARDLGVTMIVNNRPDGEEPGAAQGDEIAAAAAAAGLAYAAIPVTHAGFSAPQVEAMAAALAEIEAGGGKLLAYCRSGTRSTLLWALAAAARGESPSEIARCAGNAGYDIGPVAPMLDMLAAQHR